MCHDKLIHQKVDNQGVLLLQESTVYTLEYYCTDILVPRCTDILKAKLTGADLFPIYHKVQTYSICFGGIPHVGISIFINIFLAGCLMWDLVCIMKTKYGHVGSVVRTFNI